MIKDYFVNVPPHLSDVLAELGNVSEDADFDVIINAGRPQLFNFSYPVSAADKQPLEEYICNYYITRRIGSGNLKKWRQNLKGKMLEIMPYYKQLLDSEKLEFEPLQNNDITTTDDATGTLDQTNDKRTDNDDTYSKSGEESGKYTKDVTNTDNSTTNTTENGSSTHDATVTDNGTKSTTESGQYSKTGSETTNNTEVNRYSDTPQGDSSRIWEIDAQGHPSLTNIFLTDIRGITNNGSRNYTESGTDSKTGSETTGNTQVTDEEGTDTKTGSVTFQDRAVSDEDGTNSREWSENGTDNRDIVEHETIDQDTTHSNTNVHIGVSNQSKSSLLTEYRETFLRIYGMIAEELEPLFYNLVEVDDLIDFV